DAQVVVIKDPRTGRYFKLREPEFWLISKFDGKSDTKSLASQFNDRFGHALSPGAIEEFIKRLDDLYFLETERAEYEVSRSVHRASFGTARSLASRILYVKLTAFDPTRFLDWVLGWYRPLHGRALFGLSLLFVVFGLVVFWENKVHFTYGFWDIFALGTAPTIIISFAVIFTLHELAHALTCRLHGGEVTDVGFLLLYLQPCFYTNLSDAWLFKEKKHRLSVIWAGPLCQLMTLSFFVLVWRVTVPGTVINEIALITTVICAVTVLFNFNPLIKLDGYFLLSDWLEIPNLRTKSFAYFGAILKSRLLGIESEADPASEVAPPNRRERKIFFWYAFMTSLYTAVFLSILIYIVSGWLRPTLGGWGLLLIAALILLILRRGILSAARYVSRPVVAMKKIFASKTRAITYSGVFIVSFVIFVAAPFPEGVSGSVTIHPLDQFIISLGQGGRLRTERRIGGLRPEVYSSFINMSSLDLSALDFKLRVSAGDEVEVGDTLALLRSNQVAAAMEMAISALATLEARLKLLRTPPRPESLQVLRANVNALKSELTRTQLDYKRKEELSSKKLIAGSELENSRSAVEVAESRLSSAQSQVQLSSAPPKPEEEDVILSQISEAEANIEFLKSQIAAQVIKSPIKGRVVGSRNPNEVIAVVADGQVETMVRISDADISRVRVGSSVIMRVRSYPGDVFEGVVARIGSGDSQSEGSSDFQVAVIFPNPDRQLREGMSGYAKIDAGTGTLLGKTSRKLSSLIRVEFWSLW
ncbi:MAG: efflux RND transporter periplasmic adaptor subunit, partial [candidate division Zixibacteria bacterium]|nr:efflux RND transporter periplasmic adaptor subunit [candidate division Zixibacteria bacterium]